MARQFTREKKTKSGCVPPRDDGYPLVDAVETSSSPGQFIQELLRSRGWTQRTLAVILDIGEATLTRLLADKQPVDAGLSVVLEEIFDVPAERFLSLQRDADLAKARRTVRPDCGRATRLFVYGKLPIGEMIRRGWLKARDVRDRARVDAELTRFFGVDRLEDMEFLPSAPKSTRVSTKVTPAELAWLRRVRQLAQDMAVRAYSVRALRSAIPELRASLARQVGVGCVPRIMAECGIRFVIVETLASAQIDGACFWLGEHEPVIGLSLRFDRTEHFWFVLRHQIEHILQRHGYRDGTVMLDVALDSGWTGTAADIPEDECVANNAARDFCAPSAQLDAFLTRRGPLFSEAEMMALARELHLHPGILSRHIQRKTGKYERFGVHDVRVGPALAPHAVSDGWGNLGRAGSGAVGRSARPKLTASDGIPTRVPSVRGSDF